MRSWHSLLWLLALGRYGLAFAWEREVPLVLMNTDDLMDTGQNKLSFVCQRKGAIEQKTGFLRVDSAMGGIVSNDDSGLSMRRFVHSR